MEAAVQAHYNAPDLIAPVSAALEAQGLSLNSLDPRSLAPVDQLHTGGLRATVQMGKKLDFPPSARLLDAGCGLGGTARILATNQKLQITGIDLAPVFIQAAQTFTRWCGLESKLEFHTGSITQMPFEDKCFDGIICQHILMNIEDKDRAVAEFFRVLKPGGRLILHELYGSNDTPIHYPVPWAAGPEISFLESWKEQEKRLEQAGFVQNSWQDLTSQGIAFWDHINEMAARAARAPKKKAAAGPILGPHLIFGKNARAFKDTMASNFTSGALQWVDAEFNRPGA
ncbi:MAG: class I SAM-dependent methyltransferase [Desulfobacterales bacterium]|nr:class I SAM-dependent methyltransferase [Desulfobacterales bacterium]